MTPARILYLILAIAGTLLPVGYLLRWFDASGWSLGGMIAAWLVNDATTALVWDLTIAAVALTVFIIAECSVRRDRLSLVAIPATYLVGVSCGLPLYLFLRSRPRD